MRPRTPSGPRFTPRELPGADPAAFAARAVSTAVYRYQARIRMYAPAAAVADWMTPTSGVVEAIDEHACLVHTGSKTLDQLALWMALVGFEFEVEDPPELVEHISALAGRLTRAASRDQQRVDT